MNKKMMAFGLMMALGGVFLGLLLGYAAGRMSVQMEAEQQVVEQE